MGRDSLRHLRGYGSVTEVVVEAVAEREGVDPVELTPLLQASIDADAIESLFFVTTSGELREDIRLEFTFSGYDIVVEDGGSVEILDE